MPFPCHSLAQTPYQNVFWGTFQHLENFIGWWILLIPMAGLFVLGSIWAVWLRVLTAAIADALERLVTISPLTTALGRTQNFTAHQLQPCSWEECLFALSSKRHLICFHIWAENECRHFWHLHLHFHSFYYVPMMVTGGSFSFEEWAYHFLKWELILHSEHTAHAFLVSF